MTRAEAKATLVNVIKSWGIYSTLTILAEIVREQAEQAQGVERKKAGESIARAILRARDT
jgi:hypothetical protein